MPAGSGRSGASGEGAGIGRDRIAGLTGSRGRIARWVPTAELAAWPLAPGEAVGAVLVLREPLSLWGGFDPASGRVIDRRHPQHGVRLSGYVVLMPASRGSSSSSTVLAEALRLGTAPVALVLRRRDGILALGSLVAAELYGRGCPVVQMNAAGYRRVAASAQVQVVAGEGGALIRLG